MRARNALRSNPRQPNSMQLQTNPIATHKTEAWQTNTAAQRNVDRITALQCASHLCVRQQGRARRGAANKTMSNCSRPSAVNAMIVRPNIIDADAARARSPRARSGGLPGPREVGTARSQIPRCKSGSATPQAGSPQTRRPRHSIWEQSPANAWLICDNDIERPLYQCK